MKKQKADSEHHGGERHILLAVDGSENARRAVLYVGDFLGGNRGFRVTLLNIIPEPPADYFGSEKDRREWADKQRTESLSMLEQYRTLLVQSGFPESRVEVRLDIRFCPSLADRILEEQKKLRCCTVVMGRRGISKKEEFIFGSTSNKILHSAKNCAVWVIE